MIKKEKLDSMLPDEQRRLLTHLRELRYVIIDYFGFHLDSDLDKMENYARLVITELKSLLK